ncbi:MAG: SH3 domain-containing protein [Proteobacteria bacterium]|nr:SH3 domain-containing protein [Pseudomonadota bacterium]
MNFSVNIFHQRALSVFFFFSFLLNVLPNYGLSETMNVQGDKVNLRTSPDQKSTTSWEYGNGFPVEVLKKKGDWVMVKDFENDSGWIHRSLLQKSRQVIVKANKDNGKTINVRSGPGTDNPIVGNAYYGVVFTPLEKKGTWVHVRHDSGLTGWVKSDFLWGY